MHTCAVRHAGRSPPSTHGTARTRGKRKAVRASLPRADELQREVLCEQMAVAEEDDQVDLELDLEAARGDGGAREETREDHVYRYRPAMADRAVCNLDVLDLRRLAREPVRIATRLDAHELQLDRLDGGGALLDGDLSGERRGDVAEDAVYLAGDLEGGYVVQAALLDVLERLGHYGEGRGLQLEPSLALGRLDDKLEGTLE
mmetsp:Transcript_1392/g.3377  ORF Transcript_1392/g.3377 Transcript_1392/m.3377 type:complete len:202 (+) Transcript_1392:51-656(+)